MYYVPLGYTHSGTYNNGYRWVRKKSPLGIFVVLEKCLQHPKEYATQIILLDDIHILSRLLSVLVYNMPHFSVFLIEKSGPYQFVPAHT